MKRNLLFIGALLSGAAVFGQSVVEYSAVVNPANKKSQSVGLNMINAISDAPSDPSTAAGGPCLTWASGPAPGEAWGDLGSAPCMDTTSMMCDTSNAGFTTIGVYGSEAYALTDVVAGNDYTFDMCSGGDGAGSWIPEISILAADGTTIDASNVASGTSGATHADQCSITWTASQSGEYTIIIHEMGTSTGDSPSGNDCNTPLETNNGNPMVYCGPNFNVICPACSGGVIDATNIPSEICPWELFTLATDGSENGITALGFSATPQAGATGIDNSGNGIVLYAETLTFPTSLSDDLGGYLSANSLDPLRGMWDISVVGMDGDQVCGASDPVTINFLSGTDAQCLNSVSEAEMALNVYPNPSNGSVTIEMNGDNSVTSIEVTDMMGRVVYSGTARPGVNYRKVLDLNVADGTYMLNIVSTDAIVTRKLQIRK